MSDSQTPGPVRDRARRRLSSTLFAGVASGTTAFLAAVTVSPLAAERLGGSALWAGLPTSAAILGTALGAWAQGLAVARHGRRRTLLAGYLLGAAGALAAAVAIELEAVALLILAMAVLGIGNSSNLLARYAQAEIQPPGRRAFAISMIVWAGTIGAVLGPSLIAPAGRLAARWGAPELSGPYLVSAAFMMGAITLHAALLRPDPSTLAHREPEPAIDDVANLGARREVFASPAAVALTAMLAAQTVMMLIMTATPVHLGHLGAGLGGVGLVMTSHTFGMYALAPLAGRLADRWGRRRTIGLGFALLAAAAAIALLVPDAPTPALGAALLLLGLGWSCAFVAGSSLLAVGIPEAVRARLQGRVDAAVLGAGAAASALSGALLHLAGYALLAAIGLTILVAASLLLARHRLGPAPA
ncbi:MAG TPA: MFS transporter [Thermoanaerobaculia bacterium]|nr:MFS transporter [Thermoanaerobaculia bacterium]